MEEKTQTMAKTTMGNEDMDVEIDIEDMAIADMKIHELMHSATAYAFFKQIQEERCLITIAGPSSSNNGNEASERQTWAHGNDNKLYLLNAAYSSMKKNSKEPAWRENENDFLEQKSPMGNTVLHIAAMYGYEEGVREVVQKAPYLLNVTNSKGDTALHVAAKAGHISCLKILLAAHLRHLPVPYSENPKEAVEAILVRNDQGNTFFHEALLNGHRGVINLNNFLLVDEELIEGGFKELVAIAALFGTNKEGKSVFYLAIEGGNKELVQHAMTKLIPYPHYVPQGKSPFLAAIRKQDLEMLDIILTKKPEWIHLRDTEGRIPLHYAASIGYLKAVKILLIKFASCAMEGDRYGYFPLHLASYGGHVQVVKELLKIESRRPREILDNRGRNILHIAAESGKVDVVRHILRAANQEPEKMINDQDVNGNTPLHLATLRCHAKVVHALTWDKRVDLTVVNGKSQTALDACDPIPEKPTLRQKLTWSALKSAGVQSVQTLSSSIKVPPQSTESLWNEEAPSVDSYNDSSSNLMLVSTLIVTVTFAAGFTMPGGTNSSDPGQGMALMLHRIWFQLFIFCITISMYGAFGATIILVLTQIEYIQLVFVAVRMAKSLLGVSVAALSLAFLAGVQLVTSDLSWLATSALIMGSVFIYILLSWYYLLRFTSSSSNLVSRYFFYYPFLSLASLAESVVV